MTFAWILFCIYLIATAYLGWVGYRRTRGFGSFAIGNAAMNPFVVGITLAASTASAATFIINPGFIYIDGFSAWFHLVPGLVIGLTTMLFVLSVRFRKIGVGQGALTIPDWIGKRYGSRWFSLYFAFLSLLSFAFVVLLVGGISIVMQPLLGISNVTALIITLVFVTGYVFIGGTYAHVLTNLLQGSLMIVITILVLGSCLWSVVSSDVNVVEALRASDPYLLSPVKPDARLFGDVFTIYVAGFVIGAVLACQPHVLTKALYVKSDRDVRRYLWVFAFVFTLFALLVSVGFVSHLIIDPVELMDSTTGAIRQDLVMTVYLKNVFPDWLFTIVAVVLLAAAMSTLDGLLVSLSTITANDLFLNLLSLKQNKEYDEKKRMQWAMHAGHIVLVLSAIGAFVINLSPPRLLGIFGQVGVYGLAVALAPPLLAGVLFKQPLIRPVAALSIIALVSHFALFFRGALWLPSLPLNWANPGVTAALAALGTLPFVWLARGKDSGVSDRSFDERVI
ncbi:MAG: hypothetical protein AB8F65_04350 [Woeseiaceae bacterium]